MELQAEADLISALFKPVLHIAGRSVFGEYRSEGKERQARTHIHHKAVVPSARIHVLFRLYGLALVHGVQRLSPAAVHAQLVSHAVGPGIEYQPVPEATLSNRRQQGPLQLAAPVFGLKLRHPAVEALPPQASLGQAQAVYLRERRYKRLIRAAAELYHALCAHVQKAQALYRPVSLPDRGQRYIFVSRYQIF